MSGTSANTHSAAGLPRWVHGSWKGGGARRIFTALQAGRLVKTDYWDTCM